MPESDVPTKRRLQHRVRAMTTRPVQARGDDHVTRFTSDCLHDVARQVREEHVWLNVEHLSFLPPLGRWRDAQVELCGDGEEELFLTGEELPHYLGQFDDDALYRRIRSLPVGAAPTLDSELHYDRRNYDRVTAQQIEQECDCPAHGVERWAELPPLEYILAIPVVWGAVRFAGSFLDELGRAAGQALVAKIRSWASKSKGPDRSLVFVIEFKLNERARMCGFVIVGPSDPDNVLEQAWDNIEPLATLAGLQAEGEFLPGMIDSAFFFDGDRWHLGWWTDGERVMETTWFQQNPPDSAGVLGHPPLRKPDRGTSTDT